MFVMNKLKDHAPPLAWYYRLFVRLLHGLGCQIPDEDIQEPIQNQRLHGLTPSTTDFTYNNQSGHDPNLPDFGSLFNDPALSDLNLSEAVSSFAFSALLNSDSIDETSAAMENHDLDMSST
jgi:hypothetical protein